MMSRLHVEILDAPGRTIYHTYDSLCPQNLATGRRNSEANGFKPQVSKVSEYLILNRDFLGFSKACISAPGISEIRQITNQKLTGNSTSASKHFKGCEFTEAR